MLLRSPTPVMPLDYVTIMAERLGLYGGSFDPIHCGHLIVARAIAERLNLNRVTFLPSARPPHKKGGTHAAAAHRAEMVRLAIEGEPIFEFSDFDLKRKGASYTVDTVTHFQRRYGPDASLYWVIGADSLAELAGWHRIGTLIDACQIVTAVRTGWEHTDWKRLRTKLTETQIACLQSGMLETPVIDISSTGVRGRIRQGKSIRYLVPDSVVAYVERHGLYRASLRDNAGKRLNGKAVCKRPPGKGGAV